jgi:F0F1-type ATP synthase membrane subunit b/b'
LGVLYNLYLVYTNQHPSYSAFFANVFWSVFTFYLIAPYVRAAFWNEKLFQKAIENYQNKLQANLKNKSL